MSDCSAKSVGCSGCGSCCDPVYLPLGKADITRALADPRVGGRWRRDLEFFRAHWVPTGVVNIHSNGRRAFQYACAKFDSVNKRCTAYSDRPQVCERHPMYPWSTLEKNLAGIEKNDPECSFRALGKARLVIVEVNGRAA